MSGYVDFQVSSRWGSQWGNITDLETYRALASSSVTVPEVQTPKRPTAKAILIEVASETGVSVAELKSPSRIKHIAHARFEAMRRIRELGFSYPQIGRILNRDHTTAINGVRRAYEIIAKKEHENTVLRFPSEAKNAMINNQLVAEIVS